MKKALILNLLILAGLILAKPAFADSADVTKIQSFIQSVIQVLVTLAGVKRPFFATLSEYSWRGIGREAC